ncbi:MAG TPA: hypothetical protein H9782_11945 [Candidatus Bariatricus faecipullorum]|nr:hypothetical protein [Candidatus Bariatricus faecipullorum]
MSKIQQLIAAINVSVTQIDSQEMRIRDFNRRLEDMRSQIDTVMGTENPSAQRMLSQISATMDRNTETLRMLEAAKDRLRQIQLV